MNVTVATTLIVQGGMHADGQSAHNDGYGAGSGGYLYIFATKVIGTGSISANGGNGLSVVRGLRCPIPAPVRALPPPLPCRLREFQWPQWHASHPHRGMCCVMLSLHREELPLAVVAVSWWSSRTLWRRL
jgi:hypothetical protein